MSVADVPLAQIFGDGVPIRAKSVVPAGVLGFQPLTLLYTHSGIGVPPEGRSLEPEPQVQCMMEPVQLLQEKLPIPRTLQPEVSELIVELLDNPFEHELFEG